MSFVTRLVGMMPQTVREALREALGGGAVGGYGSPADPGLDNYVRITDRVLGMKFRRDLDQISQDQMLRIAHFLYTSNGLAEWIINVRVDMTVGAELTYELTYNHDALGIDADEARELEAQARYHLDQWWAHPAHSFKTKAAEYATTYLLTGELLLNIPEASVNPITGGFILDYIDSEAIAGVLPKNDLATVPGRVVLKRTMGNVGVAVANNATVLDVMLPDAMGKWSGQCFFFRHARRLNALRGLSDLLPLADWLDMRDQFLFSGNDAALLKNNLVHDIKVEGAQDVKDLQTEAKRFRDATLKPGGVYAHNEKISYQQVTPKFEASEQETLARVLLLNILGSRGIPEHWYSEGGNANRAVGTDQTDVTLKAMEALQTELRRIYELPLFVAYDSLAERQKIFPARMDGGVTLRVNLPVISRKDVSRLSQAMVSLEAGVSSAVEAGRLSRETGRGLVAMVVSALGYDLDPAAEAERLEKERIEREEHDAELANERAAAAIADADLPDGDPDALPVGAPGRSVPGAASVQDTMLNGAQITAITEIVRMVAEGELPRDSGIGQLVILLRLDQAEAERIMGSAGTPAFKPEKPVPPPSPFNNGGIPPKSEKQPPPVPEKQ